MASFLNEYLQSASFDLKIEIVDAVIKFSQGNQKPLLGRRISAQAIEHETEVARVRRQSRIGKTGHLRHARAGFPAEIPFPVYPHALQGFLDPGEFGISFGILVPGKKRNSCVDLIVLELAIFLSFFPNAFPVDESIA